MSEPRRFPSPAPEPPSEKKLRVVLELDAPILWILAVLVVAFVFWLAAHQ